MAWALDSDSGQPVYILDLDASRTGGKCRCVCSSCKLPLTGVNVGKAEYLIRPHFRHPNGAAEKSDCLFQAARMAAMELLKSHGLLELPSRNVRGEVIGVSGTTYEVWVRRPAERVRISDFDFQDQTCAILTLDNGQRIKILITGTGTAHVPAYGVHLPTIQYELDNSAIASLSLAELKSRLTLVPDESCWVSHWADAELLAQAQKEALQNADEFMDLAETHANELEGVELEFRRETILHLECKRILQESKTLHVPDLHVSAYEIANDGTEFEEDWGRSSEYLVLEDVTLEKRVGQGIPDVIARIPEDRGGLLLIEVTVTNKIDERRRRNFAELCIPALEIDLSNSGGVIKRSELAAWLVHGLEFKTWIFHPHRGIEYERMKATLRAKVEEIDDELQLVQEKRDAVLAVPMEEITDEYLDAIHKCAELGMMVNKSREYVPQYEAAKLNVQLAIEKMTIRGYAEAADHEVSSDHDGIIVRILSIRNGGGVCYDVHNMAGVMNAIMNLGERRRSDHSIYLIAEKTYRGNSEIRTKWFADWVKQVREAIKDGDSRYLRGGKYDNLLLLLFPEMASALANGFGTGKRSVKAPNRAWVEIPQQRQKISGELAMELASREEDGWLKGPELYDWIRKNKLTKSQR